MSKQAIEGSRLNAFGVDPNDLVIVGLDTGDGPGHPFYDPRVKLPVSEPLVVSMMTVGWFGSILVQKQKDGAVLVMDGRQRVRAAREANKRLKSAGKDCIEVACLIRRGGDADLIGVAANELRQDDEPLTKAEKAVTMLNRGRTEEEVSIAFGLSPSGLKQILALSEADPTVRKALKAGTINTSAAYELARLDVGKQAEALSELIAANGTNGKHGIGAAARNVVRKRKSNGKEVTDAPSRPVLKSVVRFAQEWDIDPTALQTIRWILGEGSMNPIKGLTAAVRAIEEKRERQKKARKEKK